MTDIELVIKIPEKVYKSIQDNDYCGISNSDMYNAISNGTPIIRGKWMFREITETIEKGVMECKCSVCGFEENTFNGGLIPFFLRDCNYCPNCGAKMEGGKPG